MSHSGATVSLFPNHGYFLSGQIVACSFTKASINIANSKEGLAFFWGRASPSRPLSLQILANVLCGMVRNGVEHV
jgi:hypothetical protein